MTCKQLIENLENLIWLIFWLSIALHLFLGLFLPWARDACNSISAMIRQNFKDHEEIFREVKKP